MSIRPAPEQLGAPSLSIGALQLWIHGYHDHGDEDAPDGDWLRVTALCAASGASVRVSGPILTVSDLRRFADECEALASGGAQTAALSPMEPELEVLIVAHEGGVRLSLEISLTPDHLTQKHAFQLELERAALAGMAAQCRELVAQFPGRAA